MARVVQFEILADDLARAKKFYEDVFGWNVHSWGTENYWLITTGGANESGIDGAIMPRTNPFKKGFMGGYHAFVCTVEGQDIVLDDMIQKVKNAGGKQLTEKKQIPNIGIQAYFEDTEGNAFGILQSNPPTNQ